MSTARKMRKRVAAVKNTRAITSAMEMIASARFRRVHRLVVAWRPYTDRFTDLVGDIAHRAGAGKIDHPLMHAPAGTNRQVLMVLTANRGLCGGYNSAVISLARERHRQMTDAGYKVSLWVSGRRGIGNLKQAGFEIERSYTELDFLPQYAQIGQLAEELMGDFLARRTGGLEVAYTQYISPSRQRPAIAEMLPMEDIEPLKPLVPIVGEPVRYEFIPSGQEILERLLPAAVRLRLWQCFLDAGLSEQVMRMTSMRAATKNADEMIHDLTVRYNRMRQAQITAELSEIMGGKVALE